MVTRIPFTVAVVHTQVALVDEVEEIEDSDLELEPELDAERDAELELDRVLDVEDVEGVVVSAPRTLDDNAKMAKDDAFIAMERR